MLFDVLVERLTKDKLSFLQYWHSRFGLVSCRVHGSEFHNPLVLIEYAQQLWHGYRQICRVEEMHIPAVPTNMEQFGMLTYHGHCCEVL